MSYVEVILPLPLADTYTYAVPAGMDALLQQGSRVLVPFGKKKYYTAIVCEIHNRIPCEEHHIREIHSLLDNHPILRRPQLQFWQWMSSYYICKMGDVYKAALPSGLKLENEKGEDTIKKRYTPKLQRFIRLTEAYQKEEKLHQFFEENKRAKQQEHLLLCFLDLSQVLKPLPTKELSQKELLTESAQTAGTLNALIKKGILEPYDKEVSRLQPPICKKQNPPTLSAEQKAAYDAIHASFQKKDVCLLHGVASSGKTEIYIRMIEDAFRIKRQVLYMLPEIAITTQITERLSKIFGDKLFVYHSKFSENERVEVWNRVLHSNEPLLVLGVRSSVFLPFASLGLVIVDEEHETSYKQQDPAPRYHARNAAIVLASMHGAKTLLGSATPAIDSYFNATSGKYGLVELNVRFGNYAEPNIHIVDVKELKRKKIMKHPLFSPPLIHQMEDAFSRKEQVILFQNRRGFAPFMECKNCRWVPKCKHCDVSLTYHKYSNLLVCHYCGYTCRLPQQCPACEERDLQMIGSGTEKIEEETLQLFPRIKVERLDFDTARTRTAYERILSDFEEGRADVLIGTQMVSKGLDFSNVSVVGVLNADSLMNFPDFRSHERAFQLMAQVSGRAGRREKQGIVVLQTAQSSHPLLSLIQRGDYKSMVSMQLSERKQFRYPPYYRMIVVMLKCKKAAVLQEMAQLYADKLRAILGERVLGPVSPPVMRVQTFFLKQVVLKIETHYAVKPIRELLEQTTRDMQQQPAFRQIFVHYDVDPA